MAIRVRDMISQLINLDPDIVLTSTDQALYDQLEQQAFRKGYAIGYDAGFQEGMGKLDEELEK